MPRSGKRIVKSAIGTGIFGKWHYAAAFATHIQSDCIFISHGFLISFIFCALRTWCYCFRRARNERKVLFGRVFILIKIAYIPFTFELGGISSIPRSEWLTTVSSILIPFLFLYEKLFSTLQVNGGLAEGWMHLNDLIVMVFRKDLGHKQRINVLNVIFSSGADQWWHQCSLFLNLFLFSSLSTFLEWFDTINN